MSPDKRTVITKPRAARTTINYFGPDVVTDPFGNQTQIFMSNIVEQVLEIVDARGVRTSFTYQMQNNGAYLVPASRRRVTTPGPARASMRSRTTAITR